MTFQRIDNSAAFFAQRNLSKTYNDLSKSVERLSSGLRINRSADDPAGLAIASGMDTQIKGLGQAIRNSNDGISIMQIADSSITEAIDILQSIKTKVISANQDTQTDSSRNLIQNDITKLLDEINLIMDSTSFNNQKLLTGSFANKIFQIGTLPGEKVNISIDSGQTTRTGHVTRGKLSLADNTAGQVKISIFNHNENIYTDINSVNVVYDNSSDNSMAAVADAINKLTDTLSIQASAVVRSSTASNLGAGTLETFSINDVSMDNFTVVSSDSNGALVAAINDKTAEHGVIASVDGSGRLTLNSTDGRAIKVSADSTGLSDVFGGDDLSTFGYVLLNQAGSKNIIVANSEGGTAVALTNNLDIQYMASASQSSTAEIGSKLAQNSVLGSSWVTGQDVIGNQFTADIVTGQNSVLVANTVLAQNSIIVAQGNLSSDVTLGAESTKTTSSGTIATGSTLISGSVLGVGTVIGNGLTLQGQTTIDATSATTGDSTIASGSVLAEGSVLESNTILSGVDVTIEQTGSTTNNSTLKANSVLAAGSVIASDSTLGDNLLVVNASSATTGASTLTSGTILAQGTVLGSTTSIGDLDVIINQTSSTSSTSTLKEGSTLTAGTVLKQGTYLGSGTFVSGLDGTQYGSGIGYTLTTDITLASDYAVVGTGADTTVTAGSTFANNTILNSGSTVAANATLASGITLISSQTLQTSTALGDNSTVASGSTFKADLTLKSATTLADDITAKAGSSLADGTVLESDSEVSADLTLKYKAYLSSTIALTLKGGSTLASGTVLNAGSVVAADLTLQASSTLSADMSNLTKEVTLGEDSILESGSILRSGSDLYATITLANNTQFSQSQEIGAGSIIEGNTSNTFIKAGSVIGGTATLASDITVINNSFSLGQGATLATGSYLSNNSTIGGTITLAEDEVVASGQSMLLGAGSIIAPGSIIAVGTYFTNDVNTTVGVVEAGSFPSSQSYTTSGTNVFGKAMALAEDSVIAKGSKLSANDGGGTSVQFSDSESLRLSDISVLSIEEADSALSVVDAAIEELNKIRSEIGGYQNQLSSHVNNLEVTKVNVESAKSNIMDIDFSEETVTFTRMNLLAQSGAFALTQANALTANVINLLQGGSGN